MPVLKPWEKPTTYVGREPPAPAVVTPARAPTRAELMRSNVPGTVTSTTPFRPRQEAPAVSATQISKIHSKIKSLENILKVTHNARIIKIVKAKIEALKSTMSSYKRSTQPKPSAPDTKSYIDNVLINISNVKKSNIKEYDISGKKVPRDQLLRDLHSTLRNLQEYQQSQAKLEEYAEKINRIKGAKAYINKEGELVTTKPPNMSDNQWQWEQVSLAPDDTTYTLVTTENGKEVEKELSKAEMLKFLQDRIDTELVTGAYKQFEKQDPLIYWIHTIGSFIQQPFKYGAQAVMEATGEATPEDRYKMQAEYLAEFGKAHKQGVVAVLNPITGLYAPYLQTFVLMPFAGSAIGGVAGKAIGYGMGRAPLATSITTRAVKAGIGGYTAGQAYNMGISYMEAKSPEEKRAVLAGGLQFATMLTTGFRGVKKGTLKEYPRGKYKQLTGYEKYYPKGYKARFTKLAEGRKPTISKWKSARQKLLAEKRTPMESALKHTETKALQKKFETAHFLKNVETLKAKPKFKHYLGKKLTIKGKKAEQFGSTTWQKEAHDIDIMTKSYWKEYPKYKYSAKQFGYDVDDIMDIKVAQKPGDIVSISGTVKQKPYTIHGRKVMRWSEQASRLSGSSLELAKAGRAKDILRSAEMYEKLWIAKGSPKELAKPLREYQRAAELVAQDPYIMPKWKSDIMYGPNLKELAQKAGAKLYYKFGKRSLEAEFRKLYPQGTQFKHVVQQGGKVPILKSPTIKMIPVSTSVSSKSVWIPSTSISPSISKSIPISISPSISKSVSVSPSVSPSISKSVSSSASVSSSVSPSVSPAPAMTITPIIPLIPPRREKKKPTKGYVVHTKRNTGAFKPTSKVLSKKQALGYGAELVDKSVDTKFKLKQVNKTPRNQPQYDTTWNRLSHKYTKKGDTYHEKTAYQKDYSIERGAYVTPKAQKRPKKAKKKFFSIIRGGKK